MSHLYMDNGYVDIPYILNRYKAVFNFLIGGRGIGKTYNILSELLNINHKFIYLRRTETEVDELLIPEMNPFKDFNNDNDVLITPFRLKKSIGFFSNVEVVEGKIQKVGSELGLFIGLSVLANVRGFGASDYTDLFYDEFIPETHKRAMRGEAEALFNGYETINRNRELKGLPPLRLIAASNSNQISNPYFLSLGIIQPIFKMIKNGESIYYDKERSLLVVYYTDSPISKKKNETALYRLTKDTDFYRMSIQNFFSTMSHSTIASRPIKEYKIYFHIGELSIYFHKSKREFYITTRTKEKATSLGTSPMQLKMLRVKYSQLWYDYLEMRCVFQEEVLEYIFVEYYQGNF